MSRKIWSVNMLDIQVRVQIKLKFKSVKFVTFFREITGEKVHVLNGLLI